MSAVIAPGIIPGLAPPAAEGPPTSTGSPVTGKTFADAVAAHRTATEATPGPAAEQAASEPNAPPGDPTAETGKPEGMWTGPSADAAGLLVLVQDLIDRASGAAGTLELEDDAAPLLDRPAGAGDAETDVNAMEALMAQMLPVRTPASPDDVTTAPVALAVAPAEASGSAAASTLAGLPPLIADVVTPNGATEAAATAATAAIAAPGTGAAAREAASAAPSAEELLAQELAARLDVPAATAPASDATSTAQAAEAQAIAALLAGDDSSLDRFATAVGTPVTAPRADGTADANALEARASDAAAAAAQLPQAQAARELPSIEGDEHGARPSRSSRVEVTAASAVAGNAPGVQGESLAAAADAAGVEVAAPGAMTAQIANTIQTAVLRGQTEVRLVLNPPELGRVEIQITETTGGIRVQMLADQPGARELIERQLPLLQAALAARDVRVERLEVGQSGEPASAQQWSNSPGSNDGQRQRGQQDGTPPDWSPLASMGFGRAESVRAERPAAASTGGLDVMA